MTNADQHTQWPCSGSRDDMLKHLWRSLTEFLRTSRPIPRVPLTPQKYLSFIGVKIDGKTIQQNADGNLYVDPYELQLALYKTQLNAFQLQQRDAEKSRQSTDALKAMVVTLQQMLDNLHAPGVAR